MTREQFGEVYSQNYGPMVRAFVARGLSHDKAEDLVQSAFLRGFKRLGQLKDDESVAGWIAAIARNAFRDDARTS